MSTRSNRALRRAVLTARRIGAELTLVHVVDDDQPVHLIERRRDGAAQMLNQMVATLADVDQVPSNMLVMTGDASAGILLAADKMRPALIIVGPHRRQLLDSLVGTTAERTIRVVDTRSDGEWGPIGSISAEPIGGGFRRRFAISGKGRLGR